MAQVIKLRRSAVAGNVPTTDQLGLGELAINTADGKIYFEKNDGSATIQTVITTNAPEFSGTVSGSAASTGSFGSIFVSNNITAKASNGTTGTGSFAHVESTTLESSNLEVGNTIEFSDDDGAIKWPGNAPTHLDKRLSLVAADATANRTITLPNATGTVTLLTNTATLTNKTIDLDANTITGTLSEFNTAMQDGSFVSLAGSETLTNKTLTSPVINGGVTGTAILDEDDLSSNSATQLATQQSIKAYIDAQNTAQDLDFQGDSGGALSIDLDSETLDIAGGTGIDTAGSSNTLTVAIDSTVTTLTGTQTLTNKTLTSPVISTIVNSGNNLTLPTTADTLVGRATTDTLTNKTLTSPIVSGLTLSDSGIVFEGDTTDDFETTLSATDPTADRTLTLPDATDTLVGRATTDTLTNKTLTSPTVSGLYLSDSSIIFEGSSADDFETTITVTNPTADRTITIPDGSGTLMFSDNAVFNGNIQLGEDVGIVFEGATSDSYQAFLHAGDPTTNDRYIALPDLGGSDLASSAVLAVTNKTQTISGANTFTSTVYVNNGFHLSLGAGVAIAMEGETADEHQIVFHGGEPTTDRHIKLPDLGGADFANAGIVALTNETQTITGANTFTSTVYVNNGNHLSLGAGVAIAMEGETADAHQIVFHGGEPTTDRHIRLPDLGGNSYANAGIVSLTNEAQTITGANTFTSTVYVNNNAFLHLGESVSIVFEGETADAHQMVFHGGEPTTDRHIRLPDLGGADYNNAGIVSLTNIAQTISATQTFTGTVYVNNGTNIQLGNDVGLQFVGATSNGFETFINVVDPTADRTINFPNASGTVLLQGDTLSTGTSIIFEGATDDDFETTLTVTDPTADRTITLPNAGGTVSLIGNTETLTNKTLTSPVINDGISGTAIKDEDNMSSNSATHLATQQSIKAYVDSQVTAQDLDASTDSGTIDIDLDSETLTIAGGTGIGTSATGTTITVAIDNTVTTLTGAQTLTNKTLTTPVISSISNTGTLTLPTSTDTLVGRATTDTLTNKTLTSPTISGLNLSDASITFEGATANDFETTLTVTDPTADRTITLPDATDTLVGRATTDTLTNKTLTSPVINDGISGTAIKDEDDMSSDSATHLATQQSIKAYVDTQLTAQDLDFQGDSGGALAVDLDSQTLTLTGGDGITTAGSGQTLTIAASVDDSSIEISSDEMRVKASGITNAMLNGSISDDKLNQITTANKVSIAALDIDGATDINADIADADIMIIDDGAGGTNRKTTVSRLKSYMQSFGGGGTFSNIQIGVTGATEIDTTTGGLTIDSAGGTTTVDDNLTVTGNLTVNGTTTSVNSNEVNIGDNIIVLNSDEAGTPSANAGIEIERGTSTNATILWDETSDYFKAGLVGAELQLATVTGTETLTNKTLTSPDINTPDIDGGTVDAITSLTVANNVDIGSYSLRASSLLADGLTSGRVLFAGTDGVLSDDSDLTFSGDTLTATKIGAFTAAGAINFNTQAMTNVDINSGTIDGATIATSDVTVGSGKTLDVSAGTLTLADDQISGDKVEGGTIASTTITSLANTTLTSTTIKDFTTVSGSVVSTGSFGHVYGSGSISGSAASTGSFGNLRVGSATIQIPSNGFITMGSEEGMVKNTRFGNNAGQNLQSGGTQNVLIGEDAGSALTTGDKNVVVGLEALKTETGGQNNTAIGHRALKTLNQNSVGGNVAVGLGAGEDLATGQFNILIGYSPETQANDDVRSIVIGSEDTVGLGDNTTVIGGTSQTIVYFGGANTIISGSAGSTGSFGTVLGVQTGSFGRVEASVINATGSISSTTSTGSFGRLETNAINTTGSIYAAGNVGVNTANFRPDATNKFMVVGKSKLSLAGETASDRLLGLEGHASQTGDAIQYFKANGSVLYSLNAEGGATASGFFSSGTGSFGRMNASVIGGNSPLTIDAELAGTISGSAFSTASFGTVVGVQTGSFGRLEANVINATGSITATGNLTLTDANNNVAIRTNYDGNASVIIGDSTTGASLTTETNNVVIGQGISAISGGENNVYIGALAAAANATPNNCVAIGYQAMATGHANERCVAIGMRTLYGNGSGINNVAVGHNAGTDTTSGVDNVFFGKGSGGTNTTGDYNVTIGSSADVSTTDAQNQIAIGYNVTSTGNNQTVIGNSSQTHVVFGGSAIISGSAASTGSFGNVFTHGSASAAGLTLTGNDSGDEILLGNFSSSIASRVAAIAAAGSGITISNNADNRILTGDGTNANAEANLTFDGTILSGSAGVTANIATASIDHLTVGGAAFATAVSSSAASSGFGDASGDFGSKLSGSVNLVSGSLISSASFGELNVQSVIQGIADGADGSTTTIAVTVVSDGGNKYAFGGSTTPNYTFLAGNTYRFTQEDSSNSGHPFRFSATANGSHGGGSEYTVGVTTAGTPGNSGAYTEIVVTNSTTSPLYYYCTNHSGMGGSAQLTTTQGAFKNHGDITFGGNMTGSADSTGSFGQINTAGNVGLGIANVAMTDPAGGTRTLHIHKDGADSAAAIRFTTGDTGTALQDGLVLEYWDGAAYLWNYENTLISFATNNTPRMTIAAGGDITMNNGLIVTNNITANGNIVGDNSTNISGVNNITALGSISATTSTGSFGRIETNVLNVTGSSNFGSDITTDSGAAINLGNNLNLGANSVIAKAGNNDIDFYTNGTNRMSILGNGNVGIGTASPGRPLHVYQGTVGDKVAVFQTVSSGHTQGITVGSGTNGNDGKGLHVGYGQQIDNGYIDAYDWDGGAYQKLKINNYFTFNAQSGMGINQASPSYKLDVTGDGRFTTDLTVGGDIILDDGGSLKEAGGTAAITFDGSGNVTKIGQDSPSSGEFLKWDGSKVVWDSASGGGGSQNLFSTIAVSGQTNVEADSTTDTLTLVAGSNMTITTNASGDSITFAAAGGGGGISISNNSDNRVLTGDGSNANAEANLTFDGSTLGLTGDLTATGNISGSATSTGSFGHLFVSSSISGSATSTGSFGALTTATGLHVSTFHAPQAFKVLNTGYVGIGKNPSTQLEVAGNVSSSATGSFSNLKIDTRILTTEKNADGVPLIGIGTTQPSAQLHLKRDDTTTDTTNGLLIEQDGAGDAVAQFLLTGTKRYIMGIDNSDSDRFRITPGQSDISSGTVHFSYGSTGVLALEGDTARIAVGASSADTQLDVRGFGRVSKFLGAGFASKVPDFTLEVHGDAVITGSISGSASTTATLATASIDHLTVAGAAFATAVSSSAASSGFGSGGGTSFGASLSGSANLISGSAVSSASFGQIISHGNILPQKDNNVDLGQSDLRWNDIYANSTTVGGVFEVGLRSKGISDYPTGTVLTWENDKCVPCKSKEDPLVMGVSRNGKDEPIVLGAEPVLVTGNVDIGDYIVTSTKEGHGIAVKRGYLLKKDLFGKVIAQALEAGDGDSYTIKAMIRKM